MAHVKLYKFRKRILTPLLAVVKINPMRCTNCGWDNISGAEKCEKCTSPLTRNPQLTMMAWQQRTQVYRVQRAQTVLMPTNFVQQKAQDGANWSGSATIRVAPTSDHQAGRSTQLMRSIGPEYVLQTQIIGPVKVCTNCGFRGTTEAKYCTNCGHQMQGQGINIPSKKPWFDRFKRIFQDNANLRTTMQICSFCKSPNPISAHFCRNCSLALKSKNPVYSGSLPIPPPTNPINTTSPAAGYEALRPNLRKTPSESVQFDMKPGDDINGYLIESFLAEGSFAKVFKVRDLFDDSLYAMKVLKLYQCRTSRERDEMTVRFEREFKVGQWRSPYLINTYDRGEIGNNPYHLQELMTGGSLSQYIRAETPFEFIHRTLLDVLRGLQFLHQKNVIHRDLKPDNILVAESTYKLADFGIAQFLNLKEDQRSAADLNTYGTPTYIAPEAYEESLGPQRYTKATDLFSFGVLAFELITGGQLPFGNPLGAEEMKDYKTKSQNGHYHFLSYYRKDLPEGWEPLMDELLEPDPGKRQNEVQAVINQIESIANGYKKVEKPYNPEDIRYKYDIFLSHAEEDSDFARLVYNSLTNRGFKVFFSKETLNDFVGQSFHEGIEEALMESQHFILICSTVALRKEWVKTEFQTFHSECYMKQPQHRRFIPLPCSGFDMGLMPPLLRRFQIAKMPEDVVRILQKH